MSNNDLEGFRHDLIIASDDGTVLHIPRDVWDRDEYRIDPKDYENHEGWSLVRDLLQCGVNLATIPPTDYLPAGKVEPMGTCYLVNIDGLKQNHKFIRGSKSPS